MRHDHDSVLYFIEDVEGAAIKIGICKKGLEDRRLETLQIGNPHHLVLIATRPGTIDDERAAHRKFQPLLIRGEWFRKADDLISFIALPGELPTVLNKRQREQWRARKRNSRKNQKRLEKLESTASFLESFNPRFEAVKLRLKDLGVQVPA